MALFSCKTPKAPEAKTSGQDFIGSIIQNDSTQVSFNVHLEDNILTFYNGVQESFEVALSGEDTLKGTFPIFASDIWLVAIKGGYSGEYFRTDAENYALQIELVPGRMTYDKALQNSLANMPLHATSAIRKNPHYCNLIKKTEYSSGLLQPQLVTVDS